ncbi:HNH endonuclease [Vibrio splendidus]|uniref:HNH endonuclease n=1 Tax=Vibrio splendidus TaxID=29497 RepID=UPI000C84A9A6|nr:HNH endonuclease [Vibrio splendidus]PMO72444.1 hypothetical protein BCT03_16635 [Vibrio splendidus]
MRKVDRTTVSYPNKLQNLTPVNLGHLRDHTKISGDVYGHADVLDSLNELYFDKCYICESDVSSGEFNVEHYLPKKHFPHLGYSWENLHKACEGCNLAKESKDFFIYDSNSICVDIKLLDPSSTVYNVYDYIRFNIDSVAESVPIGTDADIKLKASNTIKYLNGKYKSEYGKELKFLRSQKANQFLRFCNDKLYKYRDRIRDIKLLGAGGYVAPTNGEDLEADQDLCQVLINVDGTYLADKAPFSTCTKAQLFPTLRITYQELFDIKENMRAILGL